MVKIANFWKIPIGTCLETPGKMHMYDMVKIEGECSVFKKKIVMDENDALSEYNKIPLGHNRTSGAVYSKIYFKVEICSAH